MDDLRYGWVERWVSSERHKQDLRYAIRAAERAQCLAERVESLPGDYRVDESGGVRPLTGRAWFASLLRAGELKVPESVLTELGRIEDEETFWSAAEWYLERGRKTSATDAASTIRARRFAQLSRRRRCGD
jgi:hypothetical protein